MYHLLNEISATILAALFIVTALLCLIYLLEVVWNIFRAISDKERGFSYYFSDHGPEN